MARPKAALILTDDERVQLESLAHRARTAPHLARRARIILACAEGLDNRVVAGVIVSESPDSVVVQPVGAPPVTLAVKDIASRAAAKVSPMPEGLLNTLTLGEVSDLLAFLERAPGS